MFRDNLCVPSSKIKQSTSKLIAWSLKMGPTGRPKATIQCCVKPQKLRSLPVLGWLLCTITALRRICRTSSPWTMDSPCRRLGDHHSIKQRPIITLLFLVSKTSRSVLRPIQSFLPGSKATEAWGWPLTSICALVKNECSCTYTSLYVSMLCN
jgi:hypothetical protein